MLRVVIFCKYARSSLALAAMEAVNAFGMVRRAHERPDLLGSALAVVSYAMGPLARFGPVR